MQEINNTQYFKVQKDQVIEVKDVIARVYEALTEKGYNPVNQIVGYVMSGEDEVDGACLLRDVCI